MSYAILRNLPHGAIVGDDEGNLSIVNPAFLADVDASYWRDGPSVIHTTARRLIIPRLEPSKYVHLPHGTIELDEKVAGQVVTETIDLVPYAVSGYRICCGYSKTERLWAVQDD